MACETERRPGGLPQHETGTAIARRAGSGTMVVARDELGLEADRAYLIKAAILSTSGFGVE
jgi:hypothetical protein